MYNTVLELLNKFFCDKQIHAKRNCAKFKESCTSYVVEHMASFFEVILLLTDYLGYFDI